MGYKDAGLGQRACAISYASTDLLARVTPFCVYVSQNIGISLENSEGSHQTFFSNSFPLANTRLRYHLLTSGSVLIYLSYQHFSQMFTRFLSLNLILLLEEIIPAVAGEGAMRIRPVLTLNIQICLRICIG